MLPGGGKQEDAELREKLDKCDIRVSQAQLIDIDKQKWEEKFKSLKWYGPFISETSKDYFFKTWDNDGLDWGVTVYQRYSPDEIWVCWNDGEEKKILHTIVIQKDTEIKLSTSPFAPESESNSYQDSSDEIEMVKKFNFSKSDTTFNLDCIGKSCFKNPLRKEHKSTEFAKNGEKFLLMEELEEADDFGYKLTSFKLLEGAFKNFIQHDILIYDVSRLFPGVDIDGWKGEIKNLKWFGPFTNEQGTQFFFKTFSSSGAPQGFVFHFDTQENKFRIHFRDGENRECGESYEF